MKNLPDYPGTDLLDYTFPLRADVSVKLVLPRSLTLREVERLRAFLLTLVDVNATQFPS